MINKYTYERLTESDYYENPCTNCALIGNCIRDCKERIIYDRLTELEDKIEKGTLFELPFKVGDKIWRINKYSLIPRVEECTIITITIADNDRIYLEVEDEYSEFKGDNYFLTKAEAEAKLKELEEKSNVE